MQQSKKLKHKLYIALFAIVVSFLAATTATFAWYIYNTGRHTTNVHMAAGAGASLQISNSYGGTYGQSAVLDEFVGRLNPVSTNRISGGFQKVFGYTDGSENQSKLVASIFGAGESSDYYKTSLFLRTSGSDLPVYISSIGYEDSNPNSPISTAIRVGIVVHEPGKNKPETGEYVFAINTADNPQAEYNTATGREGYVLDAGKTDGTTVPFTPYTKANFCNFDNETGVITLNEGSTKLCEVTGNKDGYGTPTQVDIYIWLEGCDKDCTNNLSSMTLRNLAISFAGYSEAEE